MIIIELPIVYANNFDEIQNAKEQNIEIKIEEYVDKTTFIIPDITLIRINPGTNEKRTSIYFIGTEESFSIDIDYETVCTLFKEVIKKQQTIKK